MAVSVCVYRRPGKNYEPLNLCLTVLECCLPYPALPLTLNNVFDAVKTVRLSWKKLAKELLGWDDSFSFYRKKLDAIKRQHVSDEARLKVVVETFLLGEGCYQPSWRRLIHVLHLAHQNHVAEEIKINKEPHPGEWILV